MPSAGKHGAGCPADAAEAQIVEIFPVMWIGALLGAWWGAARLPERNRQRRPILEQRAVWCIYGNLGHAIRGDHRPSERGTPSAG